MRLIVATFDWFPIMISSSVRARFLRFLIITKPGVKRPIGFFRSVIRKYAAQYAYSFDIRNLTRQLPDISSMSAFQINARFRTAGGMFSVLEQGRICFSRKFVRDLIMSKMFVVANCNIL